jgi:hypothetical protein
LATAVMTSAVSRTCPVRLLASAFTLSVRSRHVPATPGTCACPPRRPSVPTSRATRVTSSAKVRSWSTIVLMVSLSSSTSPFTSTVIFLERSPAATALVTSAMLRTCVVSDDAIAFTLSVRSFQVPATPGTFACPPRRPSVPTSRATRVTSDAKARSWSTILLTVVPMRRNSPCTERPLISSTIFCDRSPSATALSTRATSVVGCSTSLMSELSASTVTPTRRSRRRAARAPPSAPRGPTVRLTRVTSSESPELSAATSSNMSNSSATSGSPERPSR